MTPLHVLVVGLMAYALFFVMLAITRRCLRRTRSAKAPVVRLAPPQTARTHELPPADEMAKVAKATAEFAAFQHEVDHRRRIIEGIQKATRAGVRWVQWQGEPWVSDKMKAELLSKGYTYELKGTDPRLDATNVITW